MDKSEQGRAKQIETDHADGLRENALRDEIAGLRWTVRGRTWLAIVLGMDLVVVAFFVYAGRRAFGECEAARSMSSLVLGHVQDEREAYRKQAVSLGAPPLVEIGHPVGTCSLDSAQRLERFGAELIMVTTEIRTCHDRVK